MLRMPRDKLDEERLKLEKYVSWVKRDQQGLRFEHRGYFPSFQTYVRNLTRMYVYGRGCGTNMINPYKCGQYEHARIKWNIWSY